MQHAVSFKFSTCFHWSICNGYRSYVLAYLLAASQDIWHLSFFGNAESQNITFQPRWKFICSHFHLRFFFKIIFWLLLEVLQLKCEVLSAWKRQNANGKLPTTSCLRETGCWTWKFQMEWWAAASSNRQHVNYGMCMQGHVYCSLFADGYLEISKHHRILNKFRNHILSSL